MYDEQATFGAVLLFIGVGTFLGMFLFSFFGKKENLWSGDKIEPVDGEDDYTWPEGQNFLSGVRLPMSERTKVLNVVDVLALVSLIGLVALLWWSRGQALGEEKGKLDGNVMVSAMMMQVFFASIPVIIVSFRIKAADFFGLSWRGWPHVGWLAVVACVVTYLLFYAVDCIGYKEFMAEGFGGELEQDSVKFLKDPETGMGAFWLMAVVAVVFAPLGEEFLFRGYVYPVMRRFGNPLFAIIFSGLLFSIVHFSIYALVPLFIFGMVLAYLYEITGSIWVPMLTHALFNGVSVVMSFAIKTGRLPGLE